MDPKTINRVYSTMVVKAVDEDKREITGIASTPGTDRMGDIVEPGGAEFTLPVPFLWQHDHLQPVGQVIAANVTAKGIEVRVRLVKPTPDMPSQMLARLEEAWQSIKTGLVRGLSIGFSYLDYSVIETGIRYIRWNWHELSAVTVPANAEASITSIKSLDTAARASSGSKARSGVEPAEKSAPPPGVSGTPKQPASGGFFYAPKKGKDTMNVSEQIKALEDKRKALTEERTTIQTKAVDEGRTKDGAEQERFAEITAEVSAIDKELGDLKVMEKDLITSATPVKGANDSEARASRAPAVVRSIKNEEPGIGFARFALSMFAAKGDVNSAKAFAENKFGHDARLQNVMKAAVAAGTTTSPTWAGNLVDYQNLSSEFIDFLRPRTIVGQFGVGGIPALRRVPFNSRIPGKSSAGSAGWVGEGYRKPVTSAGYVATELKWAKIAAISVVTEELERFSDPAIVQLTRDDLADAVIERMDIDFVDPDKAVGTGASESPASVTNGVTPIPSTGTDADSIRADIAALWATADSTNLPTGTAVYITDAKTARALSLLRNPLGAREFPDVRVNGAGSIDGVPLIISNYVPADSSGSMFILAFASEIYLADDGQVNIDISREATIFLDDAAATATPTAAQLVSMFQTNQLAIRAERYVRWQKRRPQAVAYLSGVNWGA